jgi:hypothetical protein
MELMIIAVFCCVVMFMVLGFGLVLFIILRQSQPYSAQEKSQAETNAADFFSQTVPNLLPWQQDALADLAARWEGTRGGFAVGQYQGVIKSLSQLDQSGWLACSLSRKGSQGFLNLRSTEHEVRLDIAGYEVQVNVEGRSLGSINLRDGTILDSTGQSIGRYQRYHGLRLQVGSQPLSARYGPLELHGRTVAEVSDGLVRSSALFDPGTSRPLLRNLVSDLTQEEENWLLALVALEFKYNAPRRGSRRAFV